MRTASPLAWLLLLAVAAGGGATERLELPVPSLQHLEEGVAGQLESARSELDALRASAEADPAELAEAFGRMGRLYFLHDLPELARLCFAAAASGAPEDFRWHYFLGVVGALEGDFGGARQRLARALELEPGDLAARLRFADASLELNLLDEAEASYRAALAAAPESAAAVFGLARLALLRGDAQDAARGFERALELQPEATSIHHSLGMAYRSLGDLERARLHLGRNRSDRVRFPDPLVEELGQLVKSGQAVFNAGIDALKRGDHSEAIRLFRAALVEKPDDYLIHYNLALAHVRSGAPDEAERELRAALELEPDYRNAHFNLAILLARQGEVAAAETHFRRAHEIDPEDRAAHLEWATALALLGRAADAERELRALLVKHPADSEALLKLASLEAGKGRGGEAATLLRRVLAGDADTGERAEAHYRLGTLVEATDPAAALAEYEAAVELGEPPFAARLALARLLGRAGRFAESARRFSEALEIDDGALEAHFGRAMALLLGGDESGAARSLEASVARHPDSVPLLHLLSRLLVASSDPAVRDGERGIELAERVFSRAQSLEHAETVAMALAEAGRFAEAVSLQRQVLAQAERAGAAATLEAARRRLTLYENGEPCRSPWASP